MPTHLDRKGLAIMTRAERRVGGVHSHKDTSDVAVITGTGQPVADHEFPPKSLGFGERSPEAIAGSATADPLRPVLDLDFDRMLTHPDRTAVMSGTPTPEPAVRAKPAADSVT